MLKTLKLILTSFPLVIIALGCSTRWTDKQRQDFAQKCSRTDTVENLSFMVTGFDYNEIKTIVVRQVRNGYIVDSFYVQPLKNSFDPIRTRYSARIDRPLPIKDTYQFVVPRQQTFILSDMKMIMWAQYSMFSEGYGCVMGDYKIDGKRFSDNAPDFVKKGFKFPWEK